MSKPVSQKNNLIGQYKIGKLAIRRILTAQARIWGKELSGA